MLPLHLPHSGFPHAREEASQATACLCCLPAPLGGMLSPCPCLPCPAPSKGCNQLVGLKGKTAAMAWAPVGTPRPGSCHSEMCLFCPSSNFPLKAIIKYELLLSEVGFIRQLITFFRNKIYYSGIQKHTCRNRTRTFTCGGDIAGN